MLALVVSACLALAHVGCGGGGREKVWKTSETLPENFPKDIPIYPTAKLTHVVHSGAAVAFWETTDPVPTVKDFYARELGKNGWKVTTYPGLAAPWMGENGVTLIATGWGRQVSFALAERGDKTVVIAVVPRMK